MAHCCEDIAVETEQLRDIIAINQAEGAWIWAIGKLEVSKEKIHTNDIAQVDQTSYPSVKLWFTNFRILKTRKVKLSGEFFVGQ